MAGKKALGLLQAGIEVRQPFHDRRPRHDDEARIGARAKHERLALADDARHVGLRSLRDSEWLTKCANMVNGRLMPSCPAIAGKGDHPAKQGGGRGAGLDTPQTIQGYLRDEASIVLRRQRSFESCAPSTTVRSLRELQWSPSPASRGRKE